jgi:hypothetical protein
MSGKKKHQRYQKQKKYCTYCKGESITNSFDNLKKYLKSKNFYEDDSAKKSLDRNIIKCLSFYNLGMGHCLVVGYNPLIKSSAKFILAIIGGSDGIAAISNQSSFDQLGSPKTHYFTNQQVRSVALDPSSCLQGNVS